MMAGHSGHGRPTHVQVRLQPPASNRHPSEPGVTSVWVGNRPQQQQQQQLSSQIAALNFNTMASTSLDNLHVLQAKGTGPFSSSQINSSSPMSRGSYQVFSAFPTTGGTHDVKWPRRQLSQDAPSRGHGTGSAWGRLSPAARGAPDTRQKASADHPETSQSYSTPFVLPQQQQYMMTASLPSGLHTASLAACSALQQPQPLATAQNQVPASSFWGGQPFNPIAPAAPANQVLLPTLQTSLPSLQTPLPPLQCSLPPLQSQLLPLQTPLLSLQNPLPSLHTSWSSLQTPLQSPLTPLQSPLTPLQSPLTPLQSPLTPLQSPLTPLQSPLTPLQSPLTPLQSPLTSLQSPLTPLQSPLTSLQSTLTPLQSPLTSLQSPLTSLQTPLQTPLTSLPTVFTPSATSQWNQAPSLSSLSGLSPLLTGAAQLASSSLQLNTSGDILSSSATALLCKPGAHLNAHYHDLTFTPGLTGTLPSPEAVHALTNSTNVGDATAETNDDQATSGVGSSVPSVPSTPSASSPSSPCSDQAYLRLPSRDPDLDLPAQLDLPGHEVSVEEMQHVTVEPCHQTPANRELCLRCGKRVYAMEKVGPVKDVLYHKACFSCAVCQTTLTLKNFHHSDSDMADLHVYCASHKPQARPNSGDASTFVIQRALTVPRLSRINEQIRGGTEAGKSAHMDTSALSIRSALQVPLKDLQTSIKVREGTWFREQRRSEGMPPEDVIRHDGATQRYEGSRSLYDSRPDS